VRRQVTTLAALALMAVAGLGGVLAARPGVAQVGTVTPGTAAIWVENSANLTSSTFNIGDPIQVCYRIPIVGMITITDFPADGSSNTFFSGVVNNTTGCLPGTVTPPSGHECMQLSYPLFGGQGQTKTCFTVAGSQPPINQLAIYINPSQSVYSVGQAIDVCYRVPAPGPIRIIDQIEVNTPTTFFAGFDDGTGGCIPGTITPPTGRECLTIVFTYTADGQQTNAQTCFQTQ
jgi:hypothetical protein